MWIMSGLKASLNFYYRFTLFYQLCPIFVHVNIGEQLVLMQFLLHRFIRSAINITRLPDDYLFHSRNAMSGHYAILYSRQCSTCIFFEVVLRVPCFRSIDYLHIVQMFHKSVINF